jgi:hypothetical protein
LNAISPCQPDDDAERTKRQMRMCAELADLGMKLARGAAARALADWAEREEPATAEALSEPEIAAPTRLAAAAKPPRAVGGAVRASTAKPTDPAVIFTRLAACVRDLIGLEVRLAAGPATPGGGATKSRGTSLALRADPRRADLHNVFRRITEHHPDRTELLRETTARVDEDLANDPDRTLDLSNIFFSICEDFGIEVDLARLPDRFLGSIDDPADPDDPDTIAS